MLKRILEHVARLRTWIFNLVLAVLFVMPEILNSPEVLAVIPAEYQRWFLVGAFLVNIWMRPRPAVLPNDPEVRAKQAPEFTGDQL
jgi:hypothetical protein